MIATNQELDHVAQTWNESILVPITQNIIGGFAAAGIAAVVAYLAFTNDFRNIAEAAGIVGTLVACGFTVIRFFADDLELLQRAYALGQKSMVPQIERLQKQVHDTNSQLEEFTVKRDVAVPTRNNQQMLSACGDAEKLIKWAFAGHGISRSDCNARGIPQRRWEKARKVLSNANIYDGEWQVETQQAALGQLQEHYKRCVAQSTKDNQYTPY